FVWAVRTSHRPDRAEPRALYLLAVTGRLARHRQSGPVSRRAEAARLARSQPGADANRWRYLPAAAGRSRLASLDARSGHRGLAADWTGRPGLWAGDSPRPDVVGSRRAGHPAVPGKREPFHGSAAVLHA